MTELMGPIVNNWRVRGVANLNATENGRVRIKTECFINSANGYWFSGLTVRGRAGVNGQFDTIDKANVNISQNSGVGLVAKEIWVARTRSAQSIVCTAEVTVSGYAAGTSKTDIRINVPAKPSHTISYNANGGSGAPGSQTKWYGETLTLSSTRPTRTGHNFQGWATSANGGVAYQPGGQYGKDSNITLYAVWKAQTHTVSYDANGGTGAPGNQTKTYGQVLTLSNTRPTRANHIFQGWSTSANGAVQYQPGGRFTADANTTLYAIWKLATQQPTIQSFTAQRVDEAGDMDESGTFVKLYVTWKCDTSGDSANTVQSVTIAVQDGGTWKETPVTASGATGTGTVTLTDLSADSSWRFRVTVRDKYGTASAFTTVGPQRFLLDFSAGGRGIGIGCGAPVNGVAIYGDPVTVNGHRIDNLPEIYSGSIVITPSGSGNRHTLFDQAKWKEITGYGNPEHNYPTVLVANGDTDARNVGMVGAGYSPKNKTWYVYLSSSVNKGDVFRVNYSILIRK